MVYDSPSIVRESRSRWQRTMNDWILNQDRFSWLDSPFLYTDLRIRYAPGFDDSIQLRTWSDRDQISLLQSHLDHLDISIASLVYVHWMNWPLLEGNRGTCAPASWHVTGRTFVFTIPPSLHNTYCVVEDKKKSGSLSAIFSKKLGSFVTYMNSMITTITRYLYWYFFQNQKEGAFRFLIICTL